MIISRVIGGLGNQMFQYAHGRALSIALDVPHRLDISGFEGNSRHNGFELDQVFDLDIRTADESDLRMVLGMRAPEFVRRVLLRNRFAKFRGRHLVVEPQLNYWPQIMRIPEDSYLIGYWQTEKYFSHAVDSVCADFAFTRPLHGLNAEAAATIGSVPSVSLHVRRGDMANNRSALAIHGLCTLDYYSRAVEYIAAHVERPQFFIFSDDSSWVREHLHIDHPCHYVQHNVGAESYNDMRLMSMCRHHIIANSSFSWWGAWLNRRADKVVVAPRRWFAIDLDSSDIVPAAWVRI
jgi:hypothetical protein